MSLKDSISVLKMKRDNESRKTLQNAIAMVVDSTTNKKKLATELKINRGQVLYRSTRH